MSAPEAAVAAAHPAEHRDYQGSKIGMWLFLFTELVLFGGMFIVYSAYRGMHPDAFHKAAGELNVVIGVVNTLVLLTSSLSVALSISALQRGRKGLSLGLIGVTMALGLVFLVNKYFEWSHEIHNGLYPGSPHLMDLPPGERLFFGLYYTMTGLHGAHVIIGLTVLGVMAWLLNKDRIRADDFIKLENAGLYWHLVDVIWIFLLPLFYLAA